NPELSGGAGVSGVRGVAGFPNGETYRIGTPKPTGYVARLFLRGTIPLSRESDTTGGDPNHLTTIEPAERIELTGGRLSLMDVFDDNAYSHDPRTQFLNWALMGNGAWDYPADTRGYTWAFVATYNRPAWAVSVAAAMMPREANGQDFDTDLSRSMGTALEVVLKERLGLPGTLRLELYHNRGKMGSYREALTAAHPDVDSVGAASGGRKWGFGLNWEEQLGRYAGVFLRAGWNDGEYESFVFTEIDRTLSAGVVLDGRWWRQDEHLLGVAAVLNGLSRDHQDYLAAGGYGFIIGDGALHYGGEAILELFYRFQLTKEIALTPDYNFIINPAYNRDRGPVHLFGMRVHVEF
ncbi:MAG TPA: carbohydrate porin, partial [Bacteroidota bacterium]